MAWEKKMLMEISLSVVRWNWGLQLCRRIDWSWTAAVSMSILIQCPSLIVIRSPPSHGLRPSLWEPYYSAPALQHSCDVQSIRRTRKPLYADWTNKSGHSDCTFINGQKCCLCWLMILSFKRIWNSKLEPHWAAFVCQHELQCTSTLFRYSEVKFGHRMFPHHKWTEENLKRALQQEMGAVFQYFSI